MFSKEVGELHEPVLWMMDRLVGVGLIELEESVLLVMRVLESCVLVGAVPHEMEWMELLLAVVGVRHVQVHVLVLYDQVVVGLHARPWVAGLKAELAGREMVQSSRPL